MFGHQSHSDDNNDISQENAAPDQSVGSSMPWQHPGTPLDDNQHDQPAAQPDDSASSNDSSDTQDTSMTDDHPAEEHQEQSQPEAEAIETQVYAPDDSAEADNGHEDDSSSVAPEPAANDLIDIKRDALGKLSPLVGHLDQTPEEKFRTTMMMIQATDNQGLIQTAYDAAQQIDDEKARAQALLDVINEINYFTQPKEKAD